MKQLKFILANLFTAGYTSLWWGFGVYKNEDLIYLIGLTSIIIVAFGIGYLVRHWGED